MNKILNIFLLVLILSGVFALKEEQTNQESGTKVVFYIENQIQQPEDYVEIKIKIKSQHQSLENAINSAQNTVNQVQSIVTKYCEAHAKNKKECLNVVSTSKYDINPIYQLVRKVPTFVAFSVSHQTVAKIKDVKNIGNLADDILKSGVSKINSFEWKPLEEVDNEEKAVTEGIELVDNICSQIGLKLGRIVAVSEVTDYENQQQEEEAAKEGEEEGEPEEQEEEQEPKVVYRFEIICSEKEAKTDIPARGGK